jgi:hypothetical protein
VVDTFFHPGLHLLSCYSKILVRCHGLYSFWARVTSPASPAGPLSHSASPAQALDCKMPTRSLNPWPKIRSISSARAHSFHSARSSYNSPKLPPFLTSTRALYHKVVFDKHEARFGVALGQGFIDASGRNVSLQNRAGSRNTSAIVGTVLFCQFWFWYPLAHYACLAFEPRSIIGLNADLKFWWMA